MKDVVVLVGDPRVCPMPAVLSIVSERVESSRFRLSASTASGLIFPFHLRAGIRLHSLIRAPEPSSLAAQDSVQSHTRSHRPGSPRTKPAKTHYTTSFIKSHTHKKKNAPHDRPSRMTAPEKSSRVHSSVLTYSAAFLAASVSAVCGKHLQEFTVLTILATR